MCAALFRALLRGRSLKNKGNEAMLITTMTVVVVPFLIVSAAVLLTLWALIFVARVSRWQRMIQNR